MEKDLKQRLRSGDLWARALYMLIFAIAYGIAEALIMLLAIFQFLAVMFTGSANERLLQFGNNLSTYVYHIIQFMTFNTETRAFPFSPWPDETMDDNPWIDDATAAVSDPEVAPQVPEVDVETAAPEASADEKADRNDPA
jgi:hypothetical protein